MQMARKDLDKKRYVEPTQRKAGPLTIFLLILGLAGLVFFVVLVLAGVLPVAIAI